MFEVAPGEPWRHLKRKDEPLVPRSPAIANRKRRNPSQNFVRKRPLRRIKESADMLPGAAEHRRDWTGMRNCWVQASQRSPALEMRYGTLSSQPTRLPAHCGRGHRRAKDAATLEEGYPQQGAVL